MKMYRYTADIKAYGAVEAESLAEAERIIDGVMQGCDTIHINEDGGIDEGGDTLVLQRATIARSRITVEN